MKNLFNFVGFNALNQKIYALLQYVYKSKISPLQFVRISLFLFSISINSLLTGYHSTEYLNILLNKDLTLFY